MPVVRPFSTTTEVTSALRRRAPFRSVSAAKA
jgi:hypothetical protein